MKIVCYFSRNFSLFNDIQSIPLQYFFRSTLSRQFPLKINISTRIIILNLSSPIIIAIKYEFISNYRSRAVLEPIWPDYRLCQVYHQGTNIHTSYNRWNGLIPPHPLTAPTISQRHVEKIPHAVLHMMSHLLIIKSS